MTEVDGTLILEHLKRLQEGQRRTNDEIRTLSAEIRGLKTIMAGFMANEVAQDTTIAGLADRVERIERRLELREEQ